MPRETLIQLWPLKTAYVISCHWQGRDYSELCPGTPLSLLSPSSDLCRCQLYWRFQCQAFCIILIFINIPLKYIYLDYWDFFGGNDAEAETPVLWPPHAKSWLIGKDSDAGRDWGQEEKGTTEDETAGWHHRLDGCESEWTPGVGDGHGGLACCDSWGCRESDTTERLNWTELNFLLSSSLRLYSLSLG